MGIGFVGDGLSVASTLARGAPVCSAGFGIAFPTLTGGDNGVATTGRSSAQETTGLSSLLCPVTAVFFLLCCFDASQGAVLSFPSKNSLLNSTVREEQSFGRTYEVTGGRKDYGVILDFTIAQLV